MYTSWSSKFRGRYQNHGWRSDYFLATKPLFVDNWMLDMVTQEEFDEQQTVPTVIQSTIHNQYFGSDHCPVSLEIQLPDEYEI